MLASVCKCHHVSFVLFSEEEAAAVSCGCSARGSRILHPDVSQVTVELEEVAAEAEVLYVLLVCIAQVFASPHFWVVALSHLLDAPA